MTSSFSSRVAQAQRENSTLLCVGLDPDPERIPAHLLESRSLADAVRTFNLSIIEATAPFACAFKLNFAFFEVLGSDGWRVLRDTVQAARAYHVVIADNKRGDIGNSARFYAAAAFESLECDACTVSPYMGSDSVQPFLAYPGRAAFVLVRTSNPGAAPLQEKTIDGVPLYLDVARRAQEWGEGHPGEVGFVVGATNAEPIERVRAAHPGIPLLIPGVGAQGGDAAAVRQALAGGTGPALINSSRQILYASSGSDFAAAAAGAAETIRAALGAPV